MVARQIRKHGRFNCRAVKSMPHKPDGACLQSKGLCVPLLEFFKRELKRRRIGRCQSRLFNLFAVEKSADGSDGGRTHAQT